MKYYVEYQYLPKGAHRPLDDGRVVDIQLTEPGEIALLPNVGDYVSIDNSAHSELSKGFSGKVASRLFRYINHDAGKNCCINIVVAEDDDDWGKLVKE